MRDMCGMAAICDVTALYVMVLICCAAVLYVMALICCAAVKKIKGLGGNSKIKSFRCFGYSGHFKQLGSVAAVTAIFLTVMFGLAAGCCLWSGVSGTVEVIAENGDSSISGNGSSISDHDSNPAKDQDISIFDMDNFDFSDADKTYEELMDGDNGQSFSELVEEIIGGNYNDKGIFEIVWQALFGVLASNRKALLQIIILAVLSALISSFLPVINNGQVSDMAQMVIKIALVTVLIASFTSACNVCVETLDNCITMYEAIVPVFFVIVAAVSGSVTGAAYYEVILIMITIINSIYKNVLVNLVRVYMLFSVADMIIGKEQFSKMCELLTSIVKTGCKAALAVFSGIGCIKGLINPVSDAYKKNMLYKSLKLVPVAGSSLEAVSQAVMGAGTVIKNSVGVAAIVAVVAVCAVPIIKLTVLTVLYKVTAAFIEPVADKNFVRVVNAAGSAIGLLTVITVMAVTMFILMTAIICIATNAHI